jgi:hypothetical protein
MGGYEESGGCLSIQERFNRLERRASLQPVSPRSCVECSLQLRARRSFAFLQASPPLARRSPQSPRARLYHLAQEQIWPHELREGGGLDRESRGLLQVPLRRPRSFPTARVSKLLTLENPLTRHHSVFLNGGEN